jgi:hypothetical protein
MPLTQYDFHLDAGAEWIRVIRLRDPNTNLLVAMSGAVMEIRNSNNVLALRLDAPSGRCLIDANDGASINLHISAADSLAYFQHGNYPGAVQAVGIWGIGRSYVYDLFCQYATGVQDRIMRGFFYVDPNITQPLANINPTLAIGVRGAS